MMLARILIATTGFLGFAGLTLAGEPPECTGKNLLPDLAVSAPKLSARLATAEQTIPNGQAILWRITGPKDAIAPSYLFGTIHLTDPRVNTLSPEALKAVEAASVVALELKEAIDPIEEAQAMRRNPGLTNMPSGRDMWSLIPDADEGVIRSAPQIRDRIDALGSLQPWVISMMLDYPLCERERIRAGLPVVDQTIGKMAVVWLTPVLGLETVEEQLSVFAEVPLETQAKFLLAQARSANQLLDFTETYKQLYLARRLSSLLLLTTQGGLSADEPDQAETAFLTDSLINKRNKVMLQRALPLVTKGNAFIAVGAAHLPGDQGLVALFRKAGYEVTPIN